MQGDVHGRLGGGIAGRQAVYIGQDVFQLERVSELREIYPLRKGGDGSHRLSQIRRHGGFSVADNPLIFNFYLHIRRGFPAIRCYGEGMRQFQLIGEKAKLHTAVAAFTHVETLRPAGAAQQGRSRQGQRGGFQKVASILHRKDW